MVVRQGVCWVTWLPTTTTTTKSHTYSTLCERHKSALFAASPQHASRPWLDYCTWQLRGNALHRALSVHLLPR